VPSAKCQEIFRQAFRQSVCNACSLLTLKLIWCIAPGSGNCISILPIYLQGASIDDTLSIHVDTLPQKEVGDGLPSCLVPAVISSAAFASQPGIPVHILRDLTSTSTSIPYPRISRNCDSNDLPIYSMTSNRYLSRRPLVLGLAKILALSLSHLPFIQAAPFTATKSIHVRDEGAQKPADNPSLWLYLGVAAALVLLGGAFAGLTIALMGQVQCALKHLMRDADREKDEIYLQVIKTSGEGAEKRHAARVLRLLKRGKHWVLVTLLLSNVITNETLPIVLDRSLGGGWPAVLGSTVLIGTIALLVWG